MEALVVGADSGVELAAPGTAPNVEAAAQHDILVELEKPMLPLRAELQERLSRTLSSAEEARALPSTRIIDADIASPLWVDGDVGKLSTLSDDPAEPSTSDEGTIFPVWYGTNRTPNTIRQGRTKVKSPLAFTSERDHRTHYGRVHVFVPDAHRFGETGNSFWTRLFRWEFRDDHLVAGEPGVLDRDKFYDEIRAAVEKGNESQALVFIHGFNVSFEEAAIRAAQIGFDLKVPGPTAFFSWPSLGSLSPASYRADGRMIQESKTALMSFLVEFAQRSGAKSVNIIAHSMGNRGLLESLREITHKPDSHANVRFNQIILAAPDITRDVFLQAAQVYAQTSQRTTLYTSNRDVALFAAPAFGDASVRVGYFKPYTVVEGVDTIAVPDFNVDQLGHSYFAQAEALLYDIADLFGSNKDPGRRQRVDAFESDGKRLWRLRR